MTCETEKALRTLARRARGARVLLSARPSQESALQLQQAERDHRDAVLEVVRLAYSRETEN
jgi:hypothetical protein